MHGGLHSECMVDVWWVHGGCMVECMVGAWCGAQRVHGGLHGGYIVCA